MPAQRAPSAASTVQVSHVLITMLQCVHPGHTLNHRSGHLKMEHTESLFLLWRHLGNWPRSKHDKRTTGSAWETWTVAAADGVRCACVRWEINFLLTFETAPFFCVYPVYYIQKYYTMKTWNLIFYHSTCFKKFQLGIIIIHLQLTCCICLQCVFSCRCTKYSYRRIFLPKPSFHQLS